MNTREIKLIVSDIDGTILDDTHQIDPNLQQVLQRLKESKIPFVLASARSPKGMQHLAEALGISEYPLACYNGALVLANGNLSAPPISSHEVAIKEVVRIISETRTHFSQVSINLYSDTVWYVDRLDEWVKKEAAITQEVAQEADLLALVQSLQIPVHKLLLIGTSAEIQKVKGYWEKQSLKTSALYLSKDNYLEVTHREVSKEKALMELASYYNVPLAQTLAIGDNFNDLPMILKAGVGVAMANAPRRVREQADAVTLLNKDSGVAAALQKFVLSITS